MTWSSQWSGEGKKVRFAVRERRSISRRDFSAIVRLRIPQVLKRICQRLRKETAAAVGRESVSVRGRHVIGWRLCAFAEEVGLHLLHDEFLVLFLPGLQAVFVEEHLHVLLPLLPCELGNVVVDALAQRSVEGRLVEALHFATHLYALHHVCHENSRTRKQRDDCQPMILRDLEEGAKRSRGWSTSIAHRAPLFFEIQLLHPFLHIG